jgi:predicted dehydrogenase
MLEFANGTTGVLFENSPPYGRPGGWSTEIFGPDGAVRVLTGEAVELTSSQRSFALRSADELHFEREIDEFVSAVLERREPSVPAAAGRAALDVALAIYESARRAEPVNLADRAPFVAGGVA